ncbi:MAG: hypothetical protein Q7Q73_03020 [Verrucomicrobiota bacterium JB024]|nr:hypothetical protein [Verrucomicrobiota bacterium JB024]
MKAILPTLFSLALLALAPAAQAQPTVWTVNADETVGADFTDLPEAIAAANEGDIIYIAGSTENYGQIDPVRIDKPLLIYGPGYLLAQNKLQSGGSTLPARVFSITIGEGGDGTLIAGLTINNLDINNVSSVYIRSNCITEEIDCYNVGYVLFAQNLLYGYDDYSNIFREMNFRIDGCSEVIITHNILLSARVEDFYRNGDITLIHNFIADTEINESEGSISFSYNVFSDVDLRYNWAWRSAQCDNNLFLQDCNVPYTAQNKGSNVFDVPMQNVYPRLVNDLSDALDYYGERIFIPEPGSAAININQTGKDAGPFGGSEPYTLAGLPNIPRISSVEAPHFSTTSQGITVRLTLAPEPTQDQ